MKLLVCTQAVDSADSNLGFFTEWIAEFAKQADSVEVICLREGAHELPPNVHVHVLPQGPRHMRVGAFYRILGKLRNRYDAVFIHMNPEYAVLGGAYWRWRGMRVALWYAHASVTLKLRIAALLVTDIFTVAPNSMRIATTKKHAVGHGIDTNLFVRIPRTTSDTIRYITTGRISATKHLLEMLRALDAVAALGRSFSLDIIGGPLTALDQCYEARLRGMIQARPYASAVRMLGAVRHDALPGYLANADVALNFSTTGNMDKAGLEALATGLPLVTTNAAFAGLLEPYGLYGTLEDIPELARILVRAAGMDVSGLARRVEEEHSLARLISLIREALQNP